MLVLILMAPSVICCLGAVGGCGPLNVSTATSMALRSQRVVPGRGGGSFPDRTQFKNVIGERLQ
jgi:hypothetical protein